MFIGDIDDAGAIAIIKKVATIDDKYKCSFPQCERDLVDLRKKLIDFFEAKTVFWWQADLPSRFARAFSQDTNEFDRFVLILLPRHLPSDISDGGTKNHLDIARHVGSIIRGSISLHMFLSILVTTDKDLLNNPQVVFLEYSSVLDYKTFDDDGRLAKTILLSNIECFKEGGNELKRVIKWESSKRRFDLLVVAILFPVVIGIASGFGETVYKESATAAAFITTSILSFNFYLQLLALIGFFIVLFFVSVRIFALRK